MMIHIYATQYLQQTTIEFPLLDNRENIEENNLDQKNLQLLLDIILFSSFYNQQNINQQNINQQNSIENNPIKNMKIILDILGELINQIKNERIKDYINGTTQNVEALFYLSEDDAMSTLMNNIKTKLEAKNKDAPNDFIGNLLKLDKTNLFEKLTYYINLSSFFQLKEEGQYILKPKEEILTIIKGNTERFQTFFLEMIKEMLYITDENYYTFNLLRKNITTTTINNNETYYKEGDIVKVKDEFTTLVNNQALMINENLLKSFPIYIVNSLWHKLNNNTSKTAIKEVVENFIKENQIDQCIDNCKECTNTSVHTDTLLSQIDTKNKKLDIFKNSLMDLLQILVTMKEKKETPENIKKTIMNYFEKIGDFFTENVNILSKNNDKFLDLLSGFMYHIGDKSSLPTERLMQSYQKISNILAKGLLDNQQDVFGNSSVIPVGVRKQIEEKKTKQPQTNLKTTKPTTPPGQSQITKKDLNTETVKHQTLDTTNHNSSVNRLTFTKTDVVEPNDNNSTLKNSNNNSYSCYTCRRR